MAGVTYFPRYSGKENVVTNNTLLLFSRIYDYSPQSFQEIISQLTASDIEVGPEITQQDRSGKSVTDGSIQQQSFRILVETKVSAGIDYDQLVRHSERFGDESVRVLLLITKHALDNEQQTAIKNRLKKGVIFGAVDFSTLCAVIEGLFAEYERDIGVVVEDYVDYCRHEQILDESKETMRIVPCGQSHELNRKYGIYYHPFRRGYRPHGYIGIYAQKSVTVLWRIRSVFDATIDDAGKLKRGAAIVGEETSDFDQKLIGIIGEALEHCGHRIRRDHRFFCGDPIDTDFRKTSKYGLRKNTYINLKEKIPDVDLDSPKAVARALKKTDWQ